MKNLFKFKAWERTLMTWCLFPFLFYGLYLIFTGGANPWWLLGTFIVYQFSMLTLSVGNHRLFVHRMFECSRFWHWAFAIWGVASGNGSAVQWTLIHIGHHMHADTPKDPHPTSLAYFFRYKHKEIVYSVPHVKYMFRNLEHRITHQYAILWVVGLALLSYCISWEFFVFCYAMPVVYHLFTGGLFYLYSHNKSGAVDRYWLEFIFPFVGEWNHKTHHARGGSRILNNQHSWWDIDWGYQFIRMIKNG